MKASHLLLALLAGSLGLAAACRQKPAQPAPAAHGGHEAAPAPAESTEMAGMKMPAEKPAAATPAGTVRLSPDRQQFLGVVLTAVERRPLTREIRTVGRVEYDERRLAFVNTKFGGWIERLDVDFTGVFVRKGQTLMAIYSPELVYVNAEEFRSVTGKGVTGTVGGRAVALGNRALLDQLGIDPGELGARAESMRTKGETAMFVAIDGAIAGVLAVADPIKPTSAEAIRTLQKDGVRVVMITGDSRSTAQAVASRLGINEVEAEILPEKKVDAVKQLQAKGRSVAMAGDGINDAPALAQAEVGIAMGTGTDIAMESAGVTLLRGDLMGIVRARALSRATMRNIKQNLFFAFVYNALGVPVAAGVLYPFFGLLLSPMIAAAAMSFSSVSVIGNSLRLGRVKV
jgi:soluble P-type ATPase